MMLSNNMSQHTVIAEKTLFDVLREVWRAKVYMAVFAMIFLVLAFAFIAVSNSFYRAEMVISPARHLGFGDDGSTDIETTDEGRRQYSRELQSKEAFIWFENTYSGRSVASFIVQDKDFLSNLASDLKFKAFIADKGRNSWDAQSLSEYLSKRVKVEQVSGTPLRKLVYLHPDKQFAEEMLTRVHRIADEMIRVRVLAETNQRIEYLNNAILKTSNPDHKRSLVSLLMEQERLKMIVSLDQPYAAAIIEPAYVLSRTCWPDPYVIFPIFVFAGLFFGYMFYGLFYFNKIIS